MNDLAKRGFSLLPNSLGEARELALIIANSEFAPKAYAGKPDSVLVAVQMGADLGLSPMQSLQNVAVINGRPSLWGDAALALVVPVLESFKEYFDGNFGEASYAAVCEAKRKGWPDVTVRRFSIADAKQAGLWGKRGHSGGDTPWITYPNRMLQMRARGFCLRDVAPDRLLGFILAEEAQDIPKEPIPVGAGSTGVSVGLAVFGQLPEPVQDNIEKAFGTLSFSPAQRLQKLNEFLGGKDASIVPDEAAETLLEWCRDEFAKRKTGHPRAKKEDGNKRTARTGSEVHRGPTHGSPDAPVASESTPSSDVSGEVVAE